MATVEQIMAKVHENYKGEFTSMSHASISTSKPDKYGAVVHTVHAHTVWTDGTETDNEFTVREYVEGDLD